MNASMTASETKLFKSQLVRHITKKDINIKKINERAIAMAIVPELAKKDSKNTTVFSKLTEEDLKEPTWAICHDMFRVTRTTLRDRAALKRQVRITKRRMVTEKQVKKETKTSSSAKKRVQAGDVPNIVKATGVPKTDTENSKTNDVCNQPEQEMGSDGNTSSQGELEKDWQKVPVLNEPFTEDDRKLTGKMQAYIMGLGTDVPVFQYPDFDHMDMVRRILEHLKTTDKRFEAITSDMYDREHPWIQACLARVREVTNDPIHLSRAILYLSSLNNPIVTPSDIKNDFKDVFRSPEPTKRFHGADAPLPQYSLAGLRRPASPKIKEMVSDKEYVVQVGKKMNECEDQIAYYQGKIRTLEAEQEGLKNGLAERFQKAPTEEGEPLTTRATSD